MAFCVNCGAQVNEGVRFCPQCGREVAGAAPAGAPPTGAAPPPTPASAGVSGMTSNVAGLLAYVLGVITGIIFLVLEPYNRDSFVRFHAFQSIFFSVGVMVISIAVGMIPFLGLLLAPLVGLAGMVLWVILMVKAYQGERFKLPVVGDLAEKQAGAPTST